MTVCHNHEPCNNSRTSRDSVWVVDSVGPTKHVLDGVHTLRIRLNWPCVAAVRPVLSNYFDHFLLIDLNCAVYALIVS